MVLLFGSCYLYDDHPYIDSHQTSAILFFFTACIVLSWSTLDGKCFKVLLSSSCLVSFCVSFLIRRSVSWQTPAIFTNMFKWIQLNVKRWGHARSSLFSSCPELSSFCMESTVHVSCQSADLSINKKMENVLRVSSVVVILSSSCCPHLICVLLDFTFGVKMQLMLFEAVKLCCHHLNTPFKPHRMCKCGLNLSASRHATQGHVGFIQTDETKLTGFNFLQDAGYSVTVSLCIR